MTVFELIKKVRSLINQRETNWKSGSTIMLDVFMRRERHIYTKPLSSDKR